MSTSFDIEWEFRDLKWALVSRVSVGRRISSAARFLTRSRGRYQALEPYLIELGEELEALLDPTGHAGLDPDLLEVLIDALSEAGAAVPLLNDMGTYRTALRGLRLRCALAYAYVGDEAGVLASMQAPSAGAPMETDLSPLDSPYESLRALRNRVASDSRAGFAKTSSRIDEVIASWDRSRAGGGILVPVIEKDARDTGVPIGSLRRIRVELFGTTAGPGDTIVTDAALAAAHDDADERILECVDAAKSRLRRSQPGHVDRSFSGIVRFESRDIPHTGRSANLAIAVQLCTEMLRVAGLRRYPRIAPGVAMTGDVAADGTVLPVDPESIEPKTRAVFFSPCSVFVIPRAHREEAESVVRRLRTRYPNRALSLLDVTSMEDVFADRRVIQTVRISAIRHAGRVLRRRRFTVAMVLVVALAGVIAWRAGIPIDGNPMIVEYAGQDLILKNRYDQELARLPVGQMTVRSAQRTTSRRYHVLADVDRDGMNDVIATNWTGGTGSPSWLFAYSVAREDTLWSKATQWELDFARSGNEIGRNFRPAFLLLDDFDRDGSPALIVIAASQYFPTVVAKLDPATGEEISHYVHAGHIYAVDRTDLTGDGIDELLLGGTNNAYDLAALVVLDPRDISGHGPATPAYTARSYASGSEVFYLTAKRSELGRRVDMRGRSYVNHVEAVPSNPAEIVLTIIDFRIGDGEAMVHGNVYLRLDASLRPIGVGTSDTYDTMASRYNIDPLRREFVDAYLSGVRHWRDAERDSAVGREPAEWITEAPGK